MNPRHVARELALFALVQTGGKSVPRPELKTLVRDAVRALTAEAEDRLQVAAEKLCDARNALSDFEREHPTNLETPLDAPIKPVPLTKEVLSQLDMGLQACELMHEAMRLPELQYHAHLTEVEEYAITLFGLVSTHMKELDTQLNALSTDWRMERMFRLDAMVLRLAAAEMRFMSDVDYSVSIDEAVELSKRYSGDDSFRLVNGILGRLAEELPVRV
jgi:N utilization substance protein B